MIKIAYVDSYTQKFTDIAQGGGGTPSLTLYFMSPVGYIFGFPVVCLIEFVGLYHMFTPNYSNVIINEKITGGGS